MTIQVSNVTTSGTTVYTSGGNTAITFMSICNYSNSTVVANVYVVPNGNVASNNNITLASLHLGAGNAGIGGGDTYQLYAASEKLLLGPGDFVSINASANNAITVITSYTTI
jgi:hypothetical protein